MQVITDTKTLADFSRELRDRAFFTVDTEFMREKTFWPILCLVQAAADGMEAIIDPLAAGLDLAPFLEALADPGVVKVFHAARQDIEIFYRLMGTVPAPVFDTQIAAMACGFGDQIGYEPLMRTLVGAQIDKGSRFTDWSHRPLTDAQLTYALSDVTYLRDGYKKLLGQLKEQNRLDWLEEEFDILRDPGLYYVKPEDAWKRLKLRGLRKNELGPLVFLAAWREREAQSRDVPRSRVLKDDAILELARQRPTDVRSLGRIRAIPNGYERSKAGAALLSVVQDGMNAASDALPKMPQDRPRDPAPPEVVELLKVLLKRQCETYDVAAKLICSMQDLDAIALDDDADVPAMKGWRRKVFGEDALRLKRGDIALRLKNGVIEITPI